MKDGETLRGLFSGVTRQTRSGYISALRAQGYDLINKYERNTFADCYARPDVSEVCIVNIEMSWAPLFYQYCQNNPDNPFLPTVHELILNDDCCIARMEKLVAHDHADVGGEDRALLRTNMKEWIAYICAEDSKVSDHWKNGYSLRETVRDILKLSQDVYKYNKGRVLPHCDLRLDNVFLRHGTDGPQFVYGDPLYPADPRNINLPNTDDGVYQPSSDHVEHLTNLDIMNKIYQAFDLPVLGPVRQKTMDLIH